MCPGFLDELNGSDKKISIDKYIIKEYAIIIIVLEHEMEK